MEKVLAERYERPITRNTIEEWLGIGLFSVAVAVAIILAVLIFISKP